MKYFLAGQSNQCRANHLRAVVRSGVVGRWGERSERANGVSGGGKAHSSERTRRFLRKERWDALPITRTHDEHGKDVPTALQRVWIGENVPIHQPPHQELRHADLLRLLPDRAGT